MINQAKVQEENVHQNLKSFPMDFAVDLTYEPTALEKAALDVKCK